MKKFLLAAAFIISVVVSQFVAVPRAEAVPDGIYNIYRYVCQDHHEVIFYIMRVDKKNALDCWFDANGNRCESDQYYNKHGHYFYYNGAEHYRVTNGQWERLG